MVYLNTNILKAPEPQILHTIATEIAHYLISNNELDPGEKDIDDLLADWGFGQNFQTARYIRAISE